MGIRIIEIVTENVIGEKSTMNYIGFFRQSHFLLPNYENSRCILVNFVDIRPLSGVKYLAVICLNRIYYYAKILGNFFHSAS